MSMFTLAMSCLTTSNLPWFMDLPFQVPMQHWSLQHQTLLPSPVTSTTGCCFCFGSVSLFFLELFFHWSPVAYWAPTDLGSSSFSVLFFFAFSYCPCCWNQIDYILAVKDGEALYSQQKQDRDLTVAQTMNSVVPNSGWNWRKEGKPLDHSRMT